MARLTISNWHWFNFLIALQVWNGKRIRLNHQVSGWILQEFVGHARDDSDRTAQFDDGQIPSCVPGDGTAFRRFIVMSDQLDSRGTVRDSF